jgi:hypothetical protein
LVFLRPYIIRDSKDFLKILQKKLEERNMFITQNYGKRQQRIIEQSIQNHAADLLGFRKDIMHVDMQFQDNTSTKLIQVGAEESKNISSQPSPVYSAPEPPPPASGESPPPPPSAPESVQPPVESPMEQLQQPAVQSTVPANAPSSNTPSSSVPESSTKTPEQVNHEEWLIKAINGE